MPISSTLINHTLTSAMARQRTARTYRRYAMQLIELRVDLREHPQRIRPLLYALGSSHRVAQRAAGFIRMLGAPGGVALATVLPTTLAAIEAEPPQNAGKLRRDDTMLCAAIALIEQLAPEHVADVYRAVARQRGPQGRSPWWTFRPWQRLNEAFQRRVVCIPGA